MEEKKKSFFDCLRVIYQSKDKDQMEADLAREDFDSFYSKYMIHRYLSMHDEFLELLEKYQIVLENMNPKSHYRFLMKVIPQRRRLWIKYISKKKK